MQVNPLIRPESALFEADLALLERYFDSYVATCPVPLVGTGLLLTDEIRYQCELYLPMDLVRRLFYRFYRASLQHPPIYGATPLHGAVSWADCYLGLPDSFQISPNPARLVRRLLDDTVLHERFIYYSFLPSRYNGAGFGRYPAQLNWIHQWFSNVAEGAPHGVSCLDAACGSGEGTWELVEAAVASGLKPEQMLCTGWTLDPLEVYAAEHRYLPHLPERQQLYRQRVAPLLQQGWNERIGFQAVDLLQMEPDGGSFDLIVCNGLLGGPVIHDIQQLQKLVRSLGTLLKPDGMLLAANHFHGGWQKKVTDLTLTTVIEQAGLETVILPEGVAAKRSRL